MVTGRRPFVGQTLQELVQMIMLGHALPPTLLVPDLSPELEQILLIAMAPNREKRFAEASVMAKALRALHLHAPAPSTSAPGFLWEKNTSVEHQTFGSTASLF